jgi:hypothetical protein
LQAEGVADGDTGLIGKNHAVRISPARFGMQYSLDKSVLHAVSSNKGYSCLAVKT